MHATWVQVAVALFTISASTFTVAMNKYLVARLHWDYPTVLTLVHLIITYMYTLGAKYTGLSKYYSKQPPPGKTDNVHFTAALLAGCMLGIAVVMQNTSLTVNTVTVYQLAKLFTTPVVAVLERIVFKRVPSPAKMLSLCLISLGLFLLGRAQHATTTTTTTPTTIAYAGTVSVLGFGVAILAVTLTAISNVIMSVLLKRYEDVGLTSISLLRQSLPYAVSLLSLYTLVMAPLSPRPGGSTTTTTTTTTTTIWEYTYTWHWLGVMILSCTGAFCVNFATTMALGRFTPLSYTMIGHTKLLLVLLLGALVYGDRVLTVDTALGVVILTSGLAYYTYLQSTVTSASSQTKLGSVADDSGQRRSARIRAKHQQ